MRSATGRQRLFLMLGFCLATAALTVAQTTRDFPPVAKAGGMTLTLAVPSTMRADAAEFFVIFENHGAITRLLNLGVDRGNQQWPEAVTFFVSRDEGPIEPWTVKTGRAAGHFEPLLTWLQPKERFSLKLVNEDFLGRDWVRRPQFTPGRYRAVATFMGETPRLFNAGPDERRSWPFWHGLLVSESADFVIVAPTLDSEATGSNPASGEVIAKDPIQR